ncbi:MAG: hypothetical protein IT291_00435 [Deltaproteobacteria bacterium]|nr:hypothetical protein [Deltaproteobacteria bacterium]
MMALGYGTVAAGAVGFCAGVGAGAAMGGVSNIGGAVSEMIYRDKSAKEAFEAAGLNTLQDAKTAAIYAASTATGVGAATKVAQHLLRTPVSLASRAISGVVTGSGAAATSTTINTTERYIVAMNEFNTTYGHLPRQNQRELYDRFMEARGLGVSQIARDTSLNIGVGIVSGGVGGGGNGLREGLKGSVGRELAVLGAESAGDLGAGMGFAALRAKLEGRELCYDEVVQEVASAVNGTMQGSVGANAACRIRAMPATDSRPAVAYVRPETMKHIVEKVHLLAGEDAGIAAIRADTTSAFFYEGSNSYLNKLGLKQNTIVLPSSGKVGERPDKLEVAAMIVHEKEHAGGGSEYSATLAQRNYEAKTRKGLRPISGAEVMAYLEDCAKAGKYATHEIEEARIEYTMDMLSKAKEGHAITLDTTMQKVLLNALDKHGKEFSSVDVSRARYNVDSGVIEQQLQKLVGACLEYYADAYPHEISKSGIRAVISELDQKALDMIKASYNDRSNDLNLTKLKALLENNSGFSLAVADELINHRMGSSLAQYLGSFKGVDHSDIATKLINAGEGDSVAEHIRNFDRLYHKDIAIKLIEATDCSALAVCLGGFKDLDSNVAIKLIEAGKNWNVAFDLASFRDLDSNVATKLINARRSYYVAERLRSFDRLHHKDIAIKLIDCKHEELVIKHIRSFNGSDQSDIAAHLIATGHGKAVAEDIRNFDSRYHKDIAIKLITAGNGGYVAKCLGSFDGLDHKDIAIKLITAGSGEYVARYLGSFDGLDHSDIAIKLIEDGAGFYVAVHIENFDNPNNELAIKLIEAGEGEKVGTKIDRFMLAQGLDTPIGEVFKLCSEPMRDVVGTFELRTIGEMCDFASRERQFVTYLGKSSSTPLHLNRDDIAFAVKEKRYVDLTEAELLRRNGVEIQKQSWDGQKVFEVLRKHSPNWSDEAIANQFERGASAFGYDKMFNYISRTDISKHDALMEFHNVIALKEHLEIPSDTFYNNILAQVKSDNQTYESGTSYHELNSIVQTTNHNKIEESLEVVKRYKDLDGLAELAQAFNSKEEVVRSWSNLKRYDSFRRLLDDAEVLEQLKELKQSSHRSLYNFLETIAFHKASRVNMDRAIEFWKDPAKFLDIGDIDTPDEIHSLKKPTNYIQIPHLDLTPEQLRDALVDGVLDRIQVIRPLEITYEFPKQEQIITSTREALQDALGTRADVNHWNKEKRGSLYKEVAGVLNQAGLKGKDGVIRYLKGEPISRDVELALEKLLSRKELNAVATSETLSVIARIHPKSSADGVLAGNDSACCMPFGSGKNNIYMFNPNTALFTIGILNAEGNRRTIAQSVITKDKDVRRRVSEITGEARTADAHIEEILPEDILREAKTYLAADNVEVAENYRNERTEKILDVVYRDFFSEYMNKFSKEEGLEHTFIPIGITNSKAFLHLETTKNTFLPLAPVAYSDKLGPDVFKLMLEPNTTRFRREVKTTSNAHSLGAEIRKENAVDVAGVYPLSFTDALPVAYIEGKAYSDNSGLIQCLHNMENLLIGVAINNAQKDRPNMSLKYTDPEGRMRGYLIAYEGRMKDDYAANASEPVIYITDFAVGQDSKLAAGKMLKAFTKLYYENYLKPGNAIPILASMREHTAYRLMKRHLDNISQELNVEFKLDEFDTYEVGEDTMHQVLIRPVMK